MQVKGNSLPPLNLMTQALVTPPIKLKLHAVTQHTQDDFVLHMHTTLTNLYNKSHNYHMKLQNYAWIMHHYAWRLGYYYFTDDFDTSADESLEFM